MQIEIKIDSSYAEPKIIIMTAAMTEDVNIIVDKLSKETPQLISGSKNEKYQDDISQKLKLYWEDDMINMKKRWFYAAYRVFPFDRQ